MNRCILYYPHIYQISDSWLRQALLYWDEIGSIVPQSYEKEKPYGNELAFLKDEGIFRPFRTELVHRERECADFLNEITDIVLSAEFQTIAGKASERVFNYDIYREKVNHDIFWILKEAGLAREKNSKWFEFEYHTGLLYMSLLAKYLASKNTEASTICGTDSADYEKLNFGAKSNSESVEGVKLKFLEMLPVPAANVSFRDIVEFKKKRAEELLDFRKVILDVQAKLRDCKTTESATRILADFSDEMKGEQLKLKRLLDENRISVIAGTIETISKVKAADWIAGVLSSGLSLVATFGINLGKYAIDKRNERSTLLHNSAFSYLYSAEQSGIL